MLWLVKKELLEWFGRGTTGRYGGYEYLIIIGTIGIVFPLLLKTSGILLLVTCAFVPISMVLSATSDAFAGERERGTLLTLMASPLSENELVAGKVLAAVLYGFALFAGGLALGTAMLRFEHVRIASAQLYAAVIAGFVLISFLVCLSGTIVSCKASSSKQALSFAIWPIIGLLLIASAVTRTANAALGQERIAALLIAASTHPLLAVLAGAALYAAVLGALWTFCVGTVRKTRSAF